MVLCGLDGVAHAQSVTAQSAAQAPAVQIDGAWVRATVKGQQATGGFWRMDLTSPSTRHPGGFESKVAKRAELHEMVMDGDDAHASH